MNIQCNSKPRVSILTPTWNRAGYIRRVWDGLNSQTYRNFEWIVANDGSEDDTVQIIRDLAAQSDFSVTLINASMRIGKSRMDNEAVRHAQGEFIIWCDSDDYLLPNAIEALLACWETIPEIERDAFVGVTALCESAEGILGNSYPIGEYSDLKLNELLLDLNSDLVIFVRSCFLKQNPFLEVDYLIPEGSVWNIIGVMKTRFIPIVLKRVSYGQTNCLSFSGLMSYSRGRAYALAVTKNYVDKITTKNRIWRMINYIRYSIHGEIEILAALHLWQAGIWAKITFLILSPLAVSLAMKDRLQGKVRKTHREFSVAKDVVEIEFYILKNK